MLILLCYLFINGANITRHSCVSEYSPTQIDHHFSELLVSPIAIPHILLSHSPRCLIPPSKSLGWWFISELLVGIFHLLWCVQIHKILWCQRLEYSIPHRNIKCKTLNLTLSSPLFHQPVFFWSSEFSHLKLFFLLQSVIPYSSGNSGTSSCSSTECLLIKYQVLLSSNLGLFVILQTT